jgi:Asp-tRNA(Asn)/Glu-tRNA(Gln) amidotransferase C subunit
MVSLTVEQVNEIKEKGFAMIPLHDGSVRKVSMDEIMVKRDDADKLLEEAKEKAKDIVNTPKIITSSNGFLRK